MKPLEDFAWRRKAKGQRHNYCRPCHSAYHREHYLANKARYVEQARIRNERERIARTRLLIDYFAEHPCADCGESDPIVLEFDHLRAKRFNIGQVFSYRNWDDVLAEIAKCDVVCANCHRRRTKRDTSCARARRSRARRWR